ncbi:MAG: hypothetical protein Fur0010_06980 [Bdellovibrio sp.]
MLSKLILAILLIHQTFAAIPTLEGLLRNPSNKEVVTDTVSLAYRISEDMVAGMAGIGAKESQQQTSGYLYQKIYWRLQDGNPESIVILTAKDQTFGERSLISVREFNFREYGQKNANKVENSLLISLFNILTINNSDSMMRVVKVANPGIKSNRELINKELDEYLRKYKEVTASRLGKKGADAIPDEDPYSTKSFNKNLANRYYESQENLKLLRTSDSFSWVYEGEKVSFEFDNSNYKLKKFHFNNLEENISFKLGDYVLFDGQHELPKYIVMQKGEFKRFKIDLLEYKNLNLRPIDFQKRISKLKEVQLQRRESENEALFVLPQL